LTHTATDASVFETLMLRYDVDLVLSGALGFNGLYYTLAPGIHYPCPNGGYPDAPPEGQVPNCVPGAEATLASGGNPPDALSSVIPEDALSGLVPTMIASGAGGKFGPDGYEAADGAAGQWHGYSIARLAANGDLIVEQRPILDWIGLDAPERTVAARSRLMLHGYGRSPLSTTTEGRSLRTSHYRISTAAITHRYDLLLADPDRPWQPCQETDGVCTTLHSNLSRDQDASGARSCAPYLCLPRRIGTVNSQTGEVRAGDGRYPEVLAVAMLSVDDEAATYPLVFKRSPSFVLDPSVRNAGTLKTSTPRLPPPPGQAPPPEPPPIPKIELPTVPPPPAIPSLTAAAPPELQPPAPPAPPPPSQQPAPVDLSVAPPGVSISTPTALIQPPTPPVNPAPPGGARREARQRQAAAQKGGADSDSEADSGRDAQSGGDLADGPASPGGLSMTRLDSKAPAAGRAQRQPSFTTLSGVDQPSAWSRGALYGGGIGLAAMTLALAFTTLRPGPRRREPEVPAPARTQARTNRF
jgi:hypothetical protein